MNVELLYRKFLVSGKVSTDTRQIIPGSVFFALRGPHFNANAFAAEALTKGASCAVVDDPAYANSDNTILVEDGLSALQALAKHHRKQLKIPVIGLTGSNGKTTTKELIHAVLSKKFNTLATKGNLNNHIGVPLTILAITQATEIAVVEMGANHVGEIALLSDIANPTHGLITNIGKAHIGTFGGFDNIIKGKTELYQHLMARQGTVFINSANPILAPMADGFTDPVLYPAEGNFYHCELMGADPFVIIRAEHGEVLNTSIMGGYNFENIAAALCIGKYFGVDQSVAHQAVANYQPQSMRSEVIQEKTNLIILDAYNANPSSMEAAIRNLAGIKSPRKVAILGDMYELEEESDAEHKKLGILLHEMEIEEVYFCGKLIRKALESFPTAQYFETRQALKDYLQANPITHAAILVKASRGMGLEGVVEALKN